MYVGGANGMLYNGAITYTPVTHPGLWQVSMDDLRVNDEKILVNTPVIFDTGSGFIFGDWERVSALYGRLGGTLKIQKGFGYYHLPCNSFPTLGVSLTFGGRSFQIPPEDLKLQPVAEGSLNCFSAIVALPSHQAVAHWIIGMTFLKGVYSVFDYGLYTGPPKVGFAVLA